MTTYFEAATGFVNIKGFRINVTARLDTENRAAMKELTESTVKMWLYIADLLTRGERTCVVEYSPETKMAARHKEIVTPLSEARVTVWGDMPGGNGFTVHSHSYAQDVLDVYWARHDALASFATNEPQQPPTPNAAQNAAFANLGSNPAIPAPIPGVITATFAPSPKKPQYAPGQMVALPVNKVSIGARNGSVAFELWGPLGKGQYPLLTVFKTKPNSTELSTDYSAAATFLGGLGLSMDAGKLEAQGNWRAVCRVAHTNGKEYLNIQSVEVAA